MRHGKKSKQLGRVARQRKALMKSLAVALIDHGKIETTLPKAKFLKPHIEKVITKAKNADLGTVRELRREFNPESLKLIVEKWVPLFKERKGGYTRIIRLNARLSDASPMAYIEFVEKPIKEATKKESPKKEAKKAEKGPKKAKVAKK